MSLRSQCRKSPKLPHHHLSRALAGLHVEVDQQPASYLIFRPGPVYQYDTECPTHMHTNTCAHTPSTDEIQMKKKAFRKCESQVWECIYRCLKMCVRRALIGRGLRVQFVKWVVYMWNARWQVRRRKVLKTRSVRTTQMGCWEEEGEEAGEKNVSRSKWAGFSQ